jgi:hypothetical protein
VGALEVVTDFSDPAFWMPLLVGIVAVVFGGVALWRQVKDRRVSKATLDLLQTMRKEIREPRPTQTGIISQSSSAQELRKREDLEWKKLKDVAKAIGWVWDRMNEKD